MTRHHRLVVASIAALAALVIAGCGSTTQPTTRLTAQQISDRAEHSAMKDAKAALAGRLSATESGVSMTMVVSGTGELVFQPAYASHLAMTVDVTSEIVSGTITGDFIEVGGKSYTKTEYNVAGMPSSGSSKYVVEDVSGAESSLLPSAETNLKVVGEETIRGDKCWHLSGTETTDARGTPVAGGTAGATTLHVDTWIRERDYYYVRMKMDGLPGLGMPAAELSQSSATGTPTASSTNLQVDLSDYDRGITITPPPADQISGTHFKVGAQVQASADWVVTVNSVRTSAGRDYDQPQAGNTFLVLDISMKNVSSQAQSVSTTMQFTLKDETGQGYGETYVSFTKTAPGGTVEAGGVTRGEVAYEVPASKHAFTLLFEPDIVGSDVTIWDITA